MIDIDQDTVLEAVPKVHDRSTIAIFKVLYPNIQYNSSCAAATSMYLKLKALKKYGLIRQTRFIRGIKYYTQTGD